jgi:hypothetical protein
MSAGHKVLQKPAITVRKNHLRNGDHIKVNINKEVQDIMTTSLLNHPDPCLSHQQLC